MKKGGISMKKESTTLIVSIVIILIIALVGFNFEEITGNLLLKENEFTPIVTIYKSVNYRRNILTARPIEEITAGTDITVKVKVRAACINPKITFHKYTFSETTNRWTSSFSIGEAIKKGTSRICKPTGYRKNYQGVYTDILNEKDEFTVSEITTGWKTGTYHASVYYYDPENKNKKTEVRVYFDVINTNE